MHIRALAMLAVSGLGAWAQSAPNVDHATVYYYYTLGHMYADLTSQSGNREYISKAIDNYKLALKADPNNAGIAEELTDFYIQSGRVREAQTEAEAALKQNPNDVSALRLLAKIYTGQISNGPQNRIDEAMLRRAIEQYQKVTALAPKDIDSWLMLGRLEKVASNSVESRKAYEKALDLDPDNEDALTGLALVYTDLGDTAKATDLLKRLADRNPSARSLQALAAAYEQMKQWGLAAEAMQRALTLNPPNAGEIKRMVAEYQLRAERYADALKSYQDLISEDPNDAQSYLRMSQIYRQQRDFAKAREAADKARGIDPMNLEIRYNDVSILQAEGKTPEAIQTLKDILDSTQKRSYSRSEKSSRSALLDQLSALYRDADQTELAVETLRQTAELDPERGARTTLAIVETYREAHEFAKAQQEMDAGIKKFPEERELRSARATLLADLGKTSEAVAEAKKLLDGKADREVYLTLASVYDKAKKFDDMGKALDQAEKLSQTGEEKELIWFQRGAMYERMKKIDLAEQQFRKVLETDPNSAGALNYIGYMLADRNLRLQESLDYITKAVEKEPENGAYLDSLGWIYFRLGRLPEAEENLRRAAVKTPHDPTVHDHLGEALMRQGKVREAIAQWQMSLHEYDTGAPADLDQAEIAKVKSKLENAKVRLAQETAPAKR